MCSATIPDPPGVGKDWLYRFDEINGVRVAFGKDFCHGLCYRSWRDCGGVEIEISDKMEVIGNVGELRKMIEDLPDSLPIFLSQKNRFFTPVFAIEGRTEIINRFGTKALEIREG